MTQDEMLQKMPRFAAGALPPDEAMQIARALKGNAALREELRLALSLREGLAAMECDPPAPGWLPPLAEAPEGIGKLREALRLSASALRLASRLT